MLVGLPEGVIKNRRGSWVHVPIVPYRFFLSRLIQHLWRNRLIKITQPRGLGCQVEILALGFHFFFWARWKARFEIDSESGVSGSIIGRCRDEEIWTFLDHRAGRIRRFFFCFCRQMLLLKPVSFLINKDLFLLFFIFVRHERSFEFGYFHKVSQICYW